MPSLLRRGTTSGTTSRGMNTTGMTTADGLITTLRWLAGLHFYRLEHTLAEILVAGTRDIDMVLFRIGSAVDAIVTAVKSTSVALVIMVVCLEVGSRKEFLVIRIKLHTKEVSLLHSHVGDV